MRRWAASVGLVLIGAAPPAERAVSGDALVDVTVNGERLKLRVEPNAQGLPLIAPAQARALGLKGGGLFAFGVGFGIGREHFSGRTESAKVGVAGAKPEGRRVGWLSRDYAPAADGTIGPTGLAESVVRFQLRPARPGEVTVAMPLQIEGGIGGALFGSWFQLHALTTAGDRPIRILFDPYHPRTLATAPAAVALAKAYAGVMTAETGRQEIAFGIERPYRVMKLARPFAVGALALSRLGVRVTDEDVTGRIAEEGVAAPEPDPDEVVVTAKSTKKPRAGLVVIGADALAACSSLTFDKPAKVVRLACLPGAGGG